MRPNAKTAAGAGSTAAVAAVAALAGVPIDQVLADAPLLVIALWWLGGKADSIEAAIVAQGAQIDAHDARIIRSIGSPK